jgi:hypothetical protein
LEPIDDIRQALKKSFIDRHIPTVVPGTDASHQQSSRTEGI